MKIPEKMHVEEGWTVKAFDPRTVGVIKTGVVTKVGRVWATIDFGLTGKSPVSLYDIVEVVETRAR